MTVPQTSQALAALVDDEQRRQDGWLQNIRALVEDSQALKLKAADDDEQQEKQKPGLLASLSSRLKGRRAQVRSVEDRLRSRIELALKETKKASLLVDRFAALREGLFADLERLHKAISEAREEEDAAEARVIAARMLVDDVNRSDHERDQARNERSKAEQQQELCSRTAERLSVVVASARGLLEVIDTLSGDVSSFARSAERELDALSARARALSVAEDAQKVVEELERALMTLSGSLDDATVFAKAVHQRVSSSTSSSTMAGALDVLVQGALARRAATAARETVSSPSSR